VSTGFWRAAGKEGEEEHDASQLLVAAVFGRSFSAPLSVVEASEALRRGGGNGMLNLASTFSRRGGAGGALGTYIWLDGTAGVGLPLVAFNVVVAVAVVVRASSNGLRRLLERPTGLCPSNLPLLRLV